MVNCTLTEDYTDRVCHVGLDPPNIAPRKIIQGGLTDPRPPLGPSIANALIKSYASATGLACQYSPPLWDHPFAPLILFIFTFRNDCYFFTENSWFLKDDDLCLHVYPSPSILTKVPYFFHGWNLREKEKEIDYMNMWSWASLPPFWISMSPLGPRELPDPFLVGYHDYAWARCCHLSMKTIEIWVLVWDMNPLKEG